MEEKKKKDKAEWLIRPRMRQTVGQAAGLAAYAAVAVAAMSVLDPILWFSGAQEAANAMRLTADALFCLWLSVLGCLAAWCHHVLVAERGFYLTRVASTLGAMFCVELAAGTLYAVTTGDVFLPFQWDIPFILGVIWLTCTAFNYNNVAAAPMRLRILLPVTAFLLMLAGSMFGDSWLMLPYTILKTAVCLLLYHPLLQLQGIAPRVVSLPPLPETTHGTDA